MRRYFFGRLVQKELRRTLLKYKLHTDQDLSRRRTATSGSTTDIVVSRRWFSTFRSEAKRGVGGGSQVAVRSGRPAFTTPAKDGNSLSRHCKPTSVAFSAGGGFGGICFRLYPAR